MLDDGIVLSCLREHLKVIAIAARSPVIGRQNQQPIAVVVRYIGVVALSLRIQVGVNLRRSRSGRGGQQSCNDKSETQHEWRSFAQSLSRQVFSRWDLHQETAAEPTNCALRRPSWLLIHVRFERFQQGFVIVLRRVNPIAHRVREQSLIWVGGQRHTGAFLRPK